MQNFVYIQLMLYCFTYWPYYLLKNRKISVSQWTVPRPRSCRNISKASLSVTFPAMWLFRTLKETISVRQINSFWILMRRLVSSPISGGRPHRKTHRIPIRSPDVIRFNFTSAVGSKIQLRNFIVSRMLYQVVVITLLFNGDNKSLIWIRERETEENYYEF